MPHSPAHGHHSDDDSPKPHNNTDLHSDGKDCDNDNAEPLHRHVRDNHSKHPHHDVPIRAGDGSKLTIPVFDHLPDHGRDLNVHYHTVEVYDEEKKKNITLEMTHPGQGREHKDEPAWHAYKFLNGTPIRVPQIPTAVKSTTQTSTSTIPDAPGGPRPSAPPLSPHGEQEEGPPSHTSKAPAPAKKASVATSRYSMHQQPGSPSSSTAPYQELRDPEQKEDSGCRCWPFC